MNLMVVGAVLTIVAPLFRGKRRPDRPPQDITNDVGLWGEVIGDPHVSHGISTTIQPNSTCGDHCLETIIMTEESFASTENNVVEEEISSTSMSPPSTCEKMASCLLLGLVFGAKYLVAHTALQNTPSVVYELFHSLNIVFIVLLAFFFLGETLKTKWQVVGIVGIVVGSIIMSSKSILLAFQPEAATNHSNSTDNTTHHLTVPVLLLNLLNGVLGGLCVVLLRKTMLYSICESTVEVTAYKTFTAALLLLPFSIWWEGSAICGINAQQAAWIGWSSLAILVYHLNLSLLCSLASSATVGLVESMRPVPAFGMIVLIQGIQTRKDGVFWVGSATILFSTLVFEVSHRCLKSKSRNEVVEMEQVRHEGVASLPNREALVELDRRRSSIRKSFSSLRSSLTSPTELTALLDRVLFENEEDPSQLDAKGTEKI